MAAGLPVRLPGSIDEPCGSDRSRLRVNWFVRIAPNTATPKAPPIERMKLSVAVAVPRSRCSTEFCTASTMTWMIIPMPRPRMIMYEEDSRKDVPTPIVESNDSEIAIKAVPVTGKRL